jgi:hypothetical protein
VNLIEQLGGYERAKHEFEMIKEMKPIYPGEIETNDRLLLEYRHQHNIFEVGDAVIRKWNGRLYYLIVDIDNDGQEFLIHHDKGAKFKDCRIFDNICNFKHATDEEIKAGKRLEVNQ